MIEEWEGMKGSDSAEKVILEEFAMILKIPVNLFKGWVSHSMKASDE